MDCFHLNVSLIAPCTLSECGGGSTLPSFPSPPSALPSSDTNHQNVGWERWKVWGHNGWSERVNTPLEACWLHLATSGTYKHRKSDGIIVVPSSWCLSMVRNVEEKDMILYVRTRRPVYWLSTPPSLTSVPHFTYRLLTPLAFLERRFHQTHDVRHDTKTWGSRE